MINTHDILKFEFLPDGSSRLKYKLSQGETPSESVYIERSLNPKETKLLVRRLSEVVNNYNKG